MQYLSGWTYRYYRFKNTWGTVAAIWRFKSHQAELESLIQWAKRKRLKKVLDLYTRQLEETEEKLFILRFRHPESVRFLSILHAFYRELSGYPRYFRADSASKYRYRVGSATKSKRGKVSTELSLLSRKGRDVRWTKESQTRR